MFPDVLKVPNNRPDHQNTNVTNGHHTAEPVTGQINRQAAALFHQIVLGIRPSGMKRQWISPRSVAIVAAEQPRYSFAPSG